MLTFTRFLQLWARKHCRWVASVIFEDTYPGSCRAAGERLFAPPTPPPIPSSRRIRWFLKRFRLCLSILNIKLSSLTTALTSRAPTVSIGSCFIFGRRGRRPCSECSSYIKYTKRGSCRTVCVKALRRVAASCVSCRYFVLNRLTLGEAAPLPARGGRGAAGGNAILCVYQGGGGGVA